MDALTRAAQAGPQSPENDKAQVAPASVPGPLKNTPDDSAAGTRAAATVGATSCKAFATLQARAALQGVELVHAHGDASGSTFFARWWGLVVHLDSADAVEVLLRRLGGGRHG